MRTSSSIRVVGGLGGIIVTAFFAAACGSKPPKTTCDCNPGEVCYTGKCRLVCVHDRDCAEVGTACRGGICMPGTVPGSCDTDADCISPGACEIAEGATCVDNVCVYAYAAESTPCDDGDLCTTADACNATGECVGTPVVCDDPPNPECLSGDSVFRIYSSSGTCENGTCVYPPIDTPCPDCATTCLSRCKDLVCPPTNGGCQTGACLPTDPPVCGYQPVPDGTRCELAGAGVGNQDGYCLSGACVECLNAEHCPPAAAAYPACFEVRCEGGDCTYPVLTDAVCMGPTCQEGVLSFERNCGEDGACPDTGTQSCNGYQCDVSGTACLTACAGDGDCMPGYVCFEGACIEPAGLGTSCTSDVQCASGHCVDGFCCESACDGVCMTCGSNGKCDLMPVDDEACGTISCDSLDTTCRDYHPITSNRCKSFGKCKEVNSTDCTDWDPRNEGAVCGPCRTCEKGWCTSYCVAPEMCCPGSYICCENCPDDPMALDCADTGM